MLPDAGTGLIKGNSSCPTPPEPWIVRMMACGARTSSHATRRLSCGHDDHVKFKFNFNAESRTLSFLSWSTFSNASKTVS